MPAIFVEGEALAVTEDTKYVGVLNDINDNNVATGYLAELSVQAENRLHL